MALKDLVIQSQLIPPRQQRGVLRRPQLEQRLALVLEYPLTLVQAGTGYGKSTALASLVHTVDRLCWYTVTEPDRDPLLFLAHLVCAFERQGATACEPVLGALEDAGGRVVPALLTPLLNALTDGVNGELVVVLDDYHLVADVPEVAALVERLVDYAPPRLHVVLSTRRLPPMEALTRWQVKGTLLTITQADLAFSIPEIQAFFREERRDRLSEEQAQTLHAETEGWAIALQMIRQSLQSGAVASIDSVLDRLPSTMETLFDYLAQDVLAQQPPATQRFLLTTSVLRHMNGPVCDFLLQVQGSAVALRQLQESGLFVVSLGDQVYRYHRLFQDFLCSQLGQSEARALHRQAAAFYHRTGHPEEAVYHFLEAQDYDQAATRIVEIGPPLVGVGRFDSLSGWIARLPPSVRQSKPGLALLTGDILRLRARFDEALQYYVAAERLCTQQNDRLGRSTALRGQAQVYLDTVRPLRADSLLEDALRLLEPEEHRRETAALLDRLAENKLNLGYPDEAQALHHEAVLLRAETDPGDVYLEARALMRTGRLRDAQTRLVRRAEEERQTDHQRPQRFHRETLLLLSLVDALLGDAQAAERHAREGIAIGQRLGSAFVEAVGTMRLGHAWQLQSSRPFDPPDQSALQHAISCYERAIEQVRTFRVMRTQVEPLWGLCRAHAFRDDLPTAERYAGQALEIVQRAGDEWMQDLVQTTMGAGYALARRSEQAQRWLSQAAAGFHRVGDPFGQSAATLWLALDAWWQGEAAQALEHLSRLLPAVRQLGHEDLLTRRTLLGLNDVQRLVPLLLEAQRRGLQTEYLGSLLEALGQGDVAYHPGYTLYVRTLGPFAAWRGEHSVLPHDWKREKARQIFQFLVTHAGQWFHREQIADQLWPHLPPDAAERDFKVALNALQAALEPDRPRGAQPFFVIRRENLYGLNPQARVVVDADDFERLSAADAADDLRHALALYQDDYLPDSLYEDWAFHERQRLKHLYLVAAERLAQQLLREGAYDETVQVCQELLARDNCWEEAYRLLMQVHAAQSNRSLVMEVYEQCTVTLREQLDIEPSAATRELLEALS